MGQHNLQQKSRQIPLGAILLSCIEKLLRRREYLDIILSSHTLPENSQQLIQRPLRETHSNISTLKLCFNHGNANSQAFCKAETKTSSQNYKMRQVRRKEKYLSQYGFLEPKAGR